MHRAAVLFGIALAPMFLDRVAEAAEERLQTTVILITETRGILPDEVPVEVGDSVDLVLRYDETTPPLVLIPDRHSAFTGALEFLEIDLVAVGSLRTTTLSPFNSVTLINDAPVFLDGVGDIRNDGLTFAVSPLIDTIDGTLLGDTPDYLSVTLVDNEQDPGPLPTMITGVAQLPAPLPQYDWISIQIVYIDESFETEVALGFRVAPRDVPEPAGWLAHAAAAAVLVFLARLRDRRKARRATVHPARIDRL